mmetsp:Transcript_55204/g.126868  ORF Transcript_55204/g.126868 Transcript_55204/m.126868 type:complete len:80 (+) Transcript_55204:2035-2274(+)
MVGEGSATWAQNGSCHSRRVETLRGGSPLDASCHEAQLCRLGTQRLQKFPKWQWQCPRRRSAFCRFQVSGGCRAPAGKG